MTRPFVSLGLKSGVWEGRLPDGPAPARVALTLNGRTVGQAEVTPGAEGGWNMFITNWMVPEISNPLGNPMLNGRGSEAWFGWPPDEAAETLKTEFIAAQTPEEQKAVAEKVQTHALDNVLLVPLGQYTLPQARRANIQNMIASPVPVFWNIEKTDG